MEQQTHVLKNYSPLSTIFLFSNLVISKFIMEGVGSGFFAMLAYLIVSVFLRGLITGDNSNFFAKKITINEINYVVIVFLIIASRGFIVYWNYFCSSRNEAANNLSRFPSSNGYCL